MNGAFALYRYPYANEYTLMKQTSGEPLTLSSCKELNGKSGFIFAPFRHTFGLPFLLLSPNIVEKHVVDELVDFDEVLFHKRDIDGERHKYEKVFSCFHDKLEIGEFSKIVLSRCSDEEAVSPLDIEKLFMRACVLYPRMFIALVSMPQCGTWLMATPEILLENNKDGIPWLLQERCPLMSTRTLICNWLNEKMLVTYMNGVRKTYVSRNMFQCI